MSVDKREDNLKSKHLPNKDHSGQEISNQDHYKGIELIQNHIKLLLETVSVGIYCLDLHGHTLYVNRFFTQLFGYSFEELMGKNIHLLLQHAAIDGRHSLSDLYSFYSMFQGKEADRIFHAKYWHKNGAPVEVEISCIPLKDNGVTVAVVVFVEDVSMRLKLQTSELIGRQKVEAQNTVLEKMAQGEPLETILEGIINLIETQLPDCICSILRLEGTQLKHGSAPGLPLAYDNAVNGVEIGPAVGSCGTAAYTKQTVIVSDIATDPLWTAFAPIALTYNLRACWSSPIFSKDGSVLGTFAVYHREPHFPDDEEQECVQQATHLAGIALEKHLREDALRKSEERFALAMDGARDGLWDWNLENNEIYFSQSYISMLGYTSSGLESNLKAWQEHIHPDDLAYVRQTFSSYFEHKIDSCELEYRMLHRDGTYRWILARGVALFDEKGRPFRMAGSITDVTEKKLQENLIKETNLGLEEANRQLLKQTIELELANSHLQSLSTNDGLTGIKNHRAFQERLIQETDRAARSKTELSVILLDVDRFKQYNETYGHPKGDTLLIDIAKSLSLHTRDMDIVCRYGGEEFAIILPETGVTKKLGEEPVNIESMSM